jgi:WD40 repeat protein
VIYAVAWYQDGTRLLAAGLDGRLSCVDVAGGETDWSVEAHNRGVTGLLVLREASPQSGAACLCVSCGMDQTLRVWQIADGLHQVRALNNHTAGVNSLALRPAEAPGLRVVASAGNDSTIRFWQPEIGRMMRFVRLESVPVSIAWTADGKTLLAGCRDGRVRSIDPDRAVVRRAIPATSDWTTAIAVNPTGETVLAGCATGLVVVPGPF